MTTQTIDAKPSSVETAAGDPATALAALRTRVTLGDIWLFGGGIVAGAFLNAGLIDQIEITVVPVALGSGRNLFAGARKRRPLRILNSRTDGSVLHSVYIPE